MPPLSTAVLAIYRAPVRDPFADQPPYADDFYNAIGRAVVMWGRLEQLIDVLVSTAAGISALRSELPETPIALGRKLRFLTETFENCATLKPLQSKAAMV